jgi:hypothetical protein
MTPKMDAEFVSALWNYAAILDRTQPPGLGTNDSSQIIDRVWKIVSEFSG